MIIAAYDNADARLADLDALTAAAHNATRLSDVAADLTLEPPNSTGDLAGPPAIDEDWLVISTVHSAKGLEWDVVHLLNAADGNFPSDMALTSKEGLEEERRLFYVAVTRPAPPPPRVRPAAVPLPAPRPRRRSHHEPAEPVPVRRRRRVLRRRARVPSRRPTGIAIDAGIRVESQLDALWS